MPDAGGINRIAYAAKQRAEQRLGQRGLVVPRNLRMQARLREGMRSRVSAWHGNLSDKPRT